MLLAVFMLLTFPRLGHACQDLVQLNVRWSGSCAMECTLVRILCHGMYAGQDLVQWNVRWSGSCAMGCTLVRILCHRMYACQDHVEWDIRAQIASLFLFSSGLAVSAVTIYVN